MTYYFCTHESNSSRGFEGILRSWILQLARCSGWDAVEAAYDDSMENDKPTDLWVILQSLLSRVPPAYLVVDGLDEVEDRNGKYTVGAQAAFLRSLLATLPQTKARLLIVSRHEKDIDRGLTVGDVAGSHLIVVKSEIQSQQTTPDIKSVAQRQVSSRFPGWGVDDQNTAVEALIKRADGMFVLLLAILEQLSDEARFFEAISVISQPLSGPSCHSTTDMLQQAYHKQTQKILGLPSSVRDFCLTVLLWVQHSPRPLKIGELLDILGLLHRKQPQSPEIPRIRTQHDLESRLLRHCTILLSVQKDTSDFQQSTLHLAHYSVKEFLQCTGFLENSQFANWRLFQGGQPTSAYLARACLLYLLQSEFSKYPAEPISSSSRGVFQYKENFAKSLERNSMFYNYASTFWWQHLDMSCEKPALVAFLTSGLGSSTSNRSPPGHLQSAMDILTQSQHLLELVEERDGKRYQKFLPVDTELRSLCLDFLGLSLEGNTCYYKIWRHYQLGVFNYQLGVFNGEDDDDYLSSARDLLAYLVRLLSHKLDKHPMWRALTLFSWPKHLVTTYGPGRRLPLQARLLESMSIRSTGLAAVLVEEGADINFTWPDNRTTLQLSAHQTAKSAMFFNVLITHFGASTELNKPRFPVHIPVGRDVFRAGGGGWFTPRVLWAFLYGNVLQRKALTAWFHERDDDYPLDVSDLNKIRIMINSHIEVNNRSLFFPSAVHAAILNDQMGKDTKVELLDVLFANKGDANLGPWLRPVGAFVGKNERNPTIRESVREMALQLLPSNGVSHGRTFGSLLRIVEHSEYHFSYGRDDVVEKVLSKKALGHNSAGWVRLEKLQIAVRRRDEKEVKTMLENGVNVNRCGAWYGSALYVASYFGHRSMVDLLLEHGADPNLAVETRILPLELETDFQWSGLWRGALTKKDAAYTPLQAAASRGHLDIVRLLLDQGANVNLNSENSGTALYFAIRGAQPRYQAAEWSQERTGGDHLHYWRDLNGKERKKSKEIIDLLLDNGAQINNCGGRYWTPVQAACVIGEVDIVNTLLHKGGDPNLVGGEWGTALQAVLANFPDPDQEAIKRGQTLQDTHPPAIPPAFFIYALCLARCAPLMDEGWDVIKLATSQPPDDRALTIAQLLLDHNANPTLQAGPWGTPIHAAAYFSSLEVLQLILDPKYSDATARRLAANTRGRAMGLAINGPAVTARNDKTALLLRHASAGFHWSPLLEMRIRRIGYGAFCRLRLLLELMWAVRDVLMFIVVIAVLTAVGTPIYMAWNELDRRSREWDPRLGGLWALFSILAAGYVATFRDTWSSDTAW